MRLLSDGITIGLIFKLCGAMGAMMKTFESGVTIGPPTLNEYAVLPVGVAIITPSASYGGSDLPLTEIENSSIEDPLRWIESSFSAHG